MLGQFAGQGLVLLALAAVVFAGQVVLQHNHLVQERYGPDAEIAVPQVATAACVGAVILGVLGAALASGGFKKAVSTEHRRLPSFDDTAACAGLAPYTHAERVMAALRSSISGDVEGDIPIGPRGLVFQTQAGGPRVLPAGAAEVAAAD